MIATAWVYARIASPFFESAKHVQRIRIQHSKPTIIPMVVQPSHPHHLQGHGPQRPTLVQQIHGTRVSAIPQDDLLTQDGGIPQRSTIPQIIGNVMLQAGGHDVALPQSTVLSMQSTCRDAYPLVFAVCRQLPHACREACQIWTFCNSSLDLSCNDSSCLLGHKCLHSVARAERSSLH